jgi:hypothetical protein
VSYSEEAELAQYVWRHHPSLLSPFELQVQRAAYVREKFADDPREHARWVMQRDGHLGDPKIDAALAGGIEAFRRSA